MSKNLNQRIQESYERSSAQVTLTNIIRFPAVRVCCVLLHLKWTNFLPTGFAQTEGGEARVDDGSGEDACRAQDGHGRDRGRQETEAGRRGRGENALPPEAETRFGGGRDEGDGGQAELALHATGAKAGRTEAAVGGVAEDTQDSTAPTAAGADGAAETDGRAENPKDSTADATPAGRATPAATASASNPEGSTPPPSATAAAA